MPAALYLLQVLSVARVRGIRPPKFVVVSRRWSYTYLLVLEALMSMSNSFRAMTMPALAILLAVVCSTVLGADDAKKIPVKDETFKCLANMTPVRGFFVDNLLGDVQATVKVANAANGKYPPGSVIQLVPTEVMIKHREGFNPVTNDWEFFELTVSDTGSKIKVRGVTEVVNRFGGNCFGCHVKAKPEFDLVCEQGHGCDPLPIKREQIVAIQQADPRCKANKL